MAELDIYGGSLMSKLPDSTYQKALQEYPTSQKVRKYYKPSNPYPSLSVDFVQ